MAQLHFPWLEISILLPLVGALIVRYPSDRQFARRVSVLFACATLAATLGEWFDFVRLGAFEAHDQWDLVAAFMHQNVLVIDELSAPLLPLTSLLYLLTIYSTLRTKAARFSMSATLFSESIMLATFSCRAGWLLIALLALALVPVWYELKFRRGESTRVFSIHAAIFVACLVVGYSLLPSDTAGVGQGISTQQLLAGAVLTVGTLLRSGVFPLHCWMPDLFDRATLGTSILTVTPMSGAYAVMRFVLPIAPAWALQAIALLSLFTAVYAAAIALVETDSRRFFCYLFISNSALVLVGLELVTAIGLTGALCLWLSVALSLTGLGLVLRGLEARVGRVDLARFNGFYDQIPTLAGLFLLTSLASIGFPGTVGFVGIELLVEGAVEVYPLVGIAVVIATALCGIAVIRAYFRIFTGTKFIATVSLAAKPSERIAVIILAFLILGGGLFPQPGVASRHHAALKLMQRRGDTVEVSEKKSAQRASDQPQPARSVGH
jgi:NADH-quinone oxidoreductase subunit M